VRIGLGTAQLGIPYGVANTLGKPDAAEALQIVESAYTSGIRWFDTAQAYGDSEAVLGECLRKLGVTQKVRVVSKLHPNIGQGNVETVGASLHESLKRLNLDCLDGFLLHREEMLKELDRSLGRRLRGLKQQGLVRRLGVSCYSTGAANRALGFDLIEILQLPGSVFDRRLLRDGIVDEARKGRCTLFVRSVFLQGLALLSAEDVPSGVPRGRAAVSTLSDFCRSRSIERKTFCLQYALHRFSPGILVIGAERSAQVTETAALASGKTLPGDLFDEWDRVWPDDIEGLIDPSVWPGTMS
jgi:aryl-alcohol dehydrogenase-like predicted oxidoreductase